MIGKISAKYDSFFAVTKVPYLQRKEGVYRPAFSQKFMDDPTV